MSRRAAEDVVELVGSGFFGAKSCGGEVKNRFSMEMESVFGIFVGADGFSGGWPDLGRGLRCRAQCFWGNFFEKAGNSVVKWENRGRSEKNSRRRRVTRIAAAPEEASCQTFAVTHNFFFNIVIRRAPLKFLFVRANSRKLTLFSAIFPPKWQ